MAWVHFLNHPLLAIILKMLLLVSVLVWFNRMPLNARSKALMWQIGLVFLVILPCLHLMFPVIELPVLPGINSIQHVIPINGETSIAFVADGLSGDIVWFCLGLILSIVSITMLITLLVQLGQLQKMTQLAKPLYKKSNQQVLEHALYQLGMNKPPQILQSQYITTPCTWGVFRPVILLPCNINDDNILKLVLLHELAHVKRKDWLWLMVSKVLLALFWFNPLVWFVQNQMINSCESACDEWVLQQQVPPSQYAETLLGFHQPQKNRQALAAHMVPKSAMYQRLQQILNPRRISMKKRNPTWLVASLSMAFILLSVAQLTVAKIEPPFENTAPPITDVAPVPEVQPEPEVLPQAPAAPTAPKAVPEAGQPAAGSSLRVPPTKPALPAPRQMPQTPTSPVGTAVPKSPRPEITMRTRQNVEQLREERQSRQVEQQRIRAEERAIKAESVQLQRELAQFNQQRQRFDGRRQLQLQLRDEANVQRIKAQKMAAEARKTRIKEHENNSELRDNRL